MKFKFEFNLMFNIPLEVKVEVEVYPKIYQYQLLAQIHSCLQIQILKNQKTVSNPNEWCILG